MFFQNIFLNQKHVTNQFKQARNCFINIKVFYQNRKYLEVQNQRTGNLADFDILW